MQSTISFTADLGDNQQLKFEYTPEGVRTQLLYKGRPQHAPKCVKLDDFRKMVDTFDALESRGVPSVALVTVNE